MNSDHTQHHHNNKNETRTHNDVDSSDDFDSNGIAQYRKIVSTKSPSGNKQASLNNAKNTTKNPHKMTANLFSSKEAKTPTPTTSPISHSNSHTVARRPSLSDIVDLSCYNFNKNHIEITGSYNASNTKPPDSPSWMPKKSKTIL